MIVLSWKKIEQTSSKRQIKARKLHTVNRPKKSPSALYFGKSTRTPPGKFETFSANSPLNSIVPLPLYVS
jgi:hypothetical protein